MPKFLSDGHFSGSSADLAVDGVLDVTGKITTLANITTIGVNQFKSVGGTGSAVAIELKGNSSGSNSDYLAKSTIYTRYDTTTPSGANNNSMMLFKVGKGTDAFQHTVLTLDSSLDATFAGNVTVSGTSSTFNTGNSGTFVTNDASNYPRFTMTSASAQLGLFRKNDGGMYIGGSSDGFRLYTTGFAQKLLVDQSGNATFAGGVNAGTKIGLPDGGDLFWDGGYGVNKPVLAANGTTMKMYPSGASGGVQFSLTPTVATFTGDVVSPGIYVGSRNTSFDFYNNGTSYLNGATTVDAAFTQSGGDASTFSGTLSASNLSGTNTGDQTLPTLSSLGALPLAGGTMTGDIVLGSNAVTGTGNSKVEVTDVYAFRYKARVNNVDDSTLRIQMHGGTTDYMSFYANDTEQFRISYHSSYSGFSCYGDGKITGNLAIGAKAANGSHTNGSPQLFFSTGNTHYNWMIAAQESTDACLELSVGDQDGTYSSDTYTPVLRLYQTGASIFAGSVTATSFIGTATNSTQLNGFTLARIDHAEDFRTYSSLNASATQAKRYHVGRLYGCPAHWDGNWQNIEIHVTAESYESANLRFSIMGDYGGAGSQANMIKLYLKEASGPYCNHFRFVLGTPVDAGWDHSSQDTYYVDLYAEVKSYGQFKMNVKSYGHDIKSSNPTSGGATTVFYDSPTVSNISAFTEEHNTLHHLTSEIYHEGHKPTLTELGAQAAGSYAAASTAITSLAFSGSTTKTLTLTQQGGGTITGSFVDTGGSSGITQAAGDTRYVNVTGDTMTGDLIINSSGVASSPILRLNNSASSSYNHAIEAINSNLTAGEAEIFVFGKATTAKNSGYIGYNWAADASNNNYVSIGQWSQNHIFRVYGDQVLSTVTLRSQSDVRGTIFYDIDDTFYKLNPQSQSTLGTLSLHGVVSGTTSGCAEFGRNHAYHTPEIKGYGAELMIGAQNAGIHINYRTCNNGASGHTPTTWYWRAGSSTSWSDHNFGKVFANGYVSANEFYDLGNTAYYVDPAGTSKINKIEHKGLSPTTGTDIDQIKEFSMSFQLSADTWTDTGINATDLASGTYAVQMRVQDYGVNGGHYDEYYSGMMSWYSGNTNDVNVDEILLHRAGHAPQSGTVQLRTERTYSADANDLMLQVKSNLPYNAALDNSNSKYMRFKFRRLI